MVYTIPENAFNSARLKVIRACQHIKNIEETLRAIREASVNSVTVEDDLKGNVPSVGINVDWAPFLSHLGAAQMAVGDAVHNLRTALDHLAYGIVSAFEVPPKNLHFPIDATRESVEGGVSFRTIKRVAPQIADFIISDIKPYGYGNPFLKLNQLDNADKHRHLIVHTGTSKITVFVSNNEYEIPCEAARCLILIKIDPGRIEGLRLPNMGTPAAAHNDDYRSAIFNICFDKGLPFAGEAILPTLHQLTQVVAGVVDALSTHCFGRENSNHLEFH